MQVLPSAQLSAANEQPRAFMKAISQLLSTRHAFNKTKHLCRGEDISNSSARAASLKQCTFRAAFEQFEVMYLQNHQCLGVYVHGGHA